MLTILVIYSGLLIVLVGTTIVAGLESGGSQVTSSQVTN